MKWSMLGFLCACSAAAPAPVAAVPVAVDAGKEWVVASEGTEMVMIEAPARVIGSPLASAVLTVPLRATVVALEVQPGDRVDAGAPLVRVVMPELLEAAGRFEGAQARLTAWTERAQQLAQLKAEGLSRAPELFEAQAKVAEAKAELQGARASILGAGFKEGDVAALLRGTGVTALRSPVSGVVTEVRAALGESREPGSGALVSVSGEGPVRLEARFSRPAPEGEFSFVTATATLPVKLVGRAPSADPRDGAFVAWFEPSPAQRLPAGTLGRVTVDARHLEGVSSVPARALHRAEGVVTVSTASGVVPVEVIHCSELACLVRGAVRPGDRLAVEAAR